MSTAARSNPPTLIVMALELESQGELEKAGATVLYTGLGKINAAVALTRALANYRHAGALLPVVVNFGTAGSCRLPSGSIIECLAFVQRDMDVTALGFERGATPFDPLPARLEVAPLFNLSSTGSCASGDSFETSGAATAADVLDMEAYAFAKVCALEGARFACVKFVTDGADAAAGNDWHANLAAAARAFAQLYRSLTAESVREA